MKVKKEKRYKRRRIKQLALAPKVGMRANIAKDFNAKVRRWNESNQRHGEMVVALLAQLSLKNNLRKESLKEQCRRRHH